MKNCQFIPLRERPEYRSLFRASIRSLKEGPGVERFTERKKNAEYHAYFYPTEVKQEERDIPFTRAGLRSARIR